MAETFAPARGRPVKFSRTFPDMSFPGSRRIFVARLGIDRSSRSGMPPQAYPSATDVKLATWPEARHVILSLLDRNEPVVRAFRIVDGQISEEELQIED